MVDGGFAVFGQAAFFEETEERRKQREEERVTSLRTGLEERRTAATERQVAIGERAELAGSEAINRETERSRLSALINNTAANLARAETQAGRSLANTQTAQNIMREIERMGVLGEQAGLFSRAEVELLFRESFDAAQSGVLERGEITGGNIRVTGTNIPGRRPGDIISQQEGQQLIASGQATAADFVEAAQETRTGPILGGAAQERNLIDSGVQAQAIIRNLEDAKAQLEIDPASGQISGDIALFANNIATNLDTLARLNGIDPSTLNDDRARFASFAEGLAGSTSRFNAALIDAAYAKALIQNGTRPTQEDFQNAYRTLTGGAQNARIIVQNIDRAIDGIIDDHNNRVNFTIPDPASRQQFLITMPTIGGEVDIRARLSALLEELRAEGLGDDEIRRRLRAERDRLRGQ